MPSRNRDGRRVALAPGVRAAAYDRDEPLAGAGHPDVEQPALLLDRLGRVGHGDGQEAVGAADEEHGIPLQALRRVQRRERDALHRGGVLLGGALLELGDEHRHPSLWVAGRGRRPAPPARRATPSARGRRRRSSGPRASSRRRGARRARGRAAAPTRRRTGRRRAGGRWRRGPPCGRRTAPRRGPGRGCRARPGRSRRTRSGRSCGTARRSPTAGARRRRARRCGSATSAASSGSLSATTSSGAGPSGRCARSSTAPERRCPPGPRRTRLASDTTWGVER